MAKAPTLARGNFLLNLNVVGAENTYLLLKDVNMKLTDLRPAWEGIEKLLEKDVNAAFESGGAAIEETWAPLAPSTLKRKPKVCGTIRKLICTGRLWNSLRVSSDGFHISRKEKLLFEFGTSVPYAIYHQAGTRKMPRRKFLMVSPKTMPAIANLLKKYIVTEGGIKGRKYLAIGEIW